jgi:hypothetical protein
MTRSRESNTFRSFIHDQKAFPDREREHQELAKAMACFIGPIHKLSGSPVNGVAIDPKGRWRESTQTVNISHEKVVPAGFHDLYAEAGTVIVPKKITPAPVRRGWLIRAILEAMKDGHRSIADIAKALNHAHHKVGECLLRMETAGLIRRVDLGIYQLEDRK